MSKWICDAEAKVKAINYEILNEASLREMWSKEQNNVEGTYTGEERNMMKIYNGNLSKKLLKINKRKIFHFLKIVAKIEKKSRIQELNFLTKFNFLSPTNFSFHILKHFPS